MIVRFLQRYAGMVAMLSGVVAYHLFVPDDAKWWMKLIVGLGATVPVYLLLFKFGVTRVGGKTPR